MNEKKPHILCLSETHITNDILENEIQIDGYNAVRCDSNSRHTGGVILYIREGIKFNKIATVAYDKTWFATISIEDANLQITVVYKSPAQKPNDFFNFLEQYISKYLDYSAHQIMVGDININVNRNTKTVKDYINVIKEHNLKQIVKDFTRFDIKN